MNMSSSSPAIKQDIPQAGANALVAEDGSPKAAPAQSSSEAVKSETPVEALKPEPMDEEENGSEEDGEESLFLALEKERENEVKEEAAHPHQQPLDAALAPKLLREALKTGELKGDESEEEEKQTTFFGKKTKSSFEKAEEEKKVDDGEGAAHHTHKRENQLDFLLSKASEFSSFIAQDLSELQNSLSEKAKAQIKAAEKAEKKSKKRKAKDGDSSKKKSKKVESEAALKSAQKKHESKIHAGSSAIFIQPPNLAEGCFLKDYQLEGVRWLSSLYENGVSGILADEMGLGKTIQVIAMIAHLLMQGVSGPYLVVAPLATLPNWVREIQKWLPQVPVCRYHGPAPTREAMLKNDLNPKHKRNPDFPIIVTSYEIAIKDQGKLDKIGPFTYLIVDEGQRLKNHRCTLIQSLKKIRANNRLLLSGTPIQNNLDELWSLLNFVNPQVFDDLSVFQSWFGFRDIGQTDKGGTEEDMILMEQRKNQTVTKLHDILRPFLLRRIKTDVLKDFPPKKEIVVYAGMSTLQAGYADLIEKGELRDLLLNQGIENARSLSQTNKQMNHRKNTNHPFLFGEPIDSASGRHLGEVHPQLLVNASGKFALLDRMLDRLHRDKHQVLIFSQMTKLLDVLEDYLRYRKWQYCRIDGTTNIDERQRQMDIFNAEKTSGADGGRNIEDDRHFVFMLSTRAGGLGINLASADTCILFDSDWNPHQDSQAMDRCHRIGQTRPVAVYRLMTVNSVDIEMMEKQISKKKLERMAITGGDFRKAGSRSCGEFSSERLVSLLADDITNLNTKGMDADSIQIDDEEFEKIMCRERLFAVGDGAVPTEGKMYDILDTNKGEVLGAMKV
uniref:Uncharacterized protein n=1 Tax=Attheya septentrionalis TaxID=420275 RepID=A0A7S2UFY8_9STRA|mmetsp:Transcript_23764/g.42898  ORF Transcript_23764/g.42898 Transcript_23764/m.42898 type:complete len:842 (+) Transcript_23764:138-2663(+)